MAEAVGTEGRFNSSINIKFCKARVKKAEEGLAIGGPGDIGYIKEN